jgi:ATP sulfurylase
VKAEVHKWLWDCAMQCLDQICMGATLISSRVGDLQDELREAAHPNLAKEPAPELCNSMCIIYIYIYSIFVQILICKYL